MGSGVAKVVGLVVALVVAAILLPIVMDQAVVVTTHANIADFTGLEAFVNLTPLLLWLAVVGGLLGFAAVSGYKAYKGRKAGKARAKR
jgi:hypothetical protein